MPTCILVLTIAAGVALLGACAAGADRASGERAPASPLAADISPLAQVSWLSGTWVGGVPVRQSEEIWSPPTGHIMTGMSRTVQADRTVFYEHLRLEARGDGVYYVAMPQGQAQAEFKLTTACEGEGVSEAVFENPAHDFPTRIVYRRSGDVLHARIEGVRGGQPAAVDFEFKRP